MGRDLRTGLRLVGHANMDRTGSARPNRARPDSIGADRLRSVLEHGRTRPSTAEAAALIPGTRPAGPARHGHPAGWHAGRRSVPASRPGSGLAGRMARTPRAALSPHRDRTTAPRRSRAGAGGARRHSRKPTCPGRYHHHRGVHHDRSLSLAVDRRRFGLNAPRGTRGSVSAGLRGALPSRLRWGVVYGGLRLSRTNAHSARQRDIGSTVIVTRKLLSDR